MAQCVMCEGCDAGDTLKITQFLSYHSCPLSNNCCIIPVVLVFRQ